MSTPVPAVRQRLNRALVIDIAAGIADAEGLDAVTLQRIANDSGVKQPALYRHVSGIDDLLEQLALRARAALTNDLTLAHTGRSRDEAVRAVSAAWRAFVQQHPGLYSATDRVPSVGNPTIEQSLAGVVQTLVNALSGYRLSTEQRGQCARTLRSALHGFCVLEKDRGHPEPYAVNEGLDNLVDLFCRGVEALETP